MAAPPQDPAHLGEGESGSNQWNAWAAVTASTERSGNGIASAVPSRIVTSPGSARGAPAWRDRLDGDDLGPGGTSSGSACRSPQRSSTRPGPIPPWPTLWATASAG